MFLRREGRRGRGRAQQPHSRGTGRGVASGLQEGSRGPGDANPPRAHATAPNTARSTGLTHSTGHTNAWRGLTNTETRHGHIHHQPRRSRLMHWLVRWTGSRHGIWDAWLCCRWTPHNSVGAPFRQNPTPAWAPHRHRPVQPSAPGPAPPRAGTGTQPHRCRRRSPPAESPRCRECGQFTVQRGAPGGGWDLSERVGTRLSSERMLLHVSLSPTPLVPAEQQEAAAGVGSAHPTPLLSWTHGDSPPQDAARPWLQTGAENPSRRPGSGQALGRSVMRPPHCPPCLSLAALTLSVAERAVAMLSVWSPRCRPCRTVTWGTPHMCHL